MSDPTLGEKARGRVLHALVLLGGYSAAGAERELAEAEAAARAKAFTDAAGWLEKAASQCRETSKVNEGSSNKNIDARWHENLERAAKVYDDAAREMRTRAEESPHGS